MAISKKENEAFKLIMIIFMIFILSIVIYGLLFGKQTNSKQEIPLSVEIFDNPNIKSIKIWRNISQIDTLYSVDFNNYVSYDDLTLDSLKLAIRYFPKSIYKKQ